VEGGIGVVDMVEGGRSKMETLSPIEVKVDELINNESFYQLVKRNHI